MNCVFPTKHFLERKRKIFWENHMHVKYLKFPLTLVTSRIFIFVTSCGCNFFFKDVKRLTLILSCRRRRRHKEKCCLSFNWGSYSLYTHKHLPVSIYYTSLYRCVNETHILLLFSTISLLILCLCIQP